MKQLLVLALTFISFQIFAQTTGPNISDIQKWYDVQSKKADRSMANKINQKALELLSLKEVSDALDKKNFYPIICDGISISLVFLNSESSTCSALFYNHADDKLETFTFKMQLSGKGHTLTVIGGGSTKTIGAIITDDNIYNIFGGYSLDSYISAGTQTEFNFRDVDNYKVNDSVIVNNNNVEKLITTKIQSKANVGIFVGNIILSPYSKR